MKFTNNHRIIFSYSTLFILVSLNTVFFPVWLNDTIKLSIQQIGLILGTVGLLKIFSSFFIFFDTYDFFTNHPNSRKY